MTSPQRDVRHGRERVAVIDMGGEITSHSETDLMDAYGRAVGGDTRTVVLNFSELEYMNSGGIGLLVTLLIRANRNGLRLVACGLSDHYRQIFSLTRLDEAIVCFDDEEEAMTVS